VNLPQARTLVRLLEDLGEPDVYATLRRPSDINSEACIAELHYRLDGAYSHRGAGAFEIEADGEAVLLDMPEES
jgi:hypothetical protein